MASRSDDGALADDNGEDAEPGDVADDEADAVVDDRPRSKPGRVARARGSVTSGVEPRKSDASTKWAVDRLDEREKRFSFVAAGGAVLFGVIVYLAETENSKFRLHKGQLTPQTTLLVGLVAGALLFGATLLGRRAPIGFLALFTGIALSNSFFLLSLPFLALAIWILYHSYKIQKETSAKLRAARTESRATRSGPSRSGPSRSGSSKTGAGSTRKNRASGPVRPEANKRYTPKRPPPQAPKPSRRERKATEAPD